MVTFDYKKTPITQIADYIIMFAAKSGASDIHFDPRENGLMVRIRIDGELQDYSLVPTEYERNLITRLKLLANMNITESRLPQDGAIKGTFGSLFLDMRVSCLPTNEGEKIVIRILDYSRSLEGLQKLGFSHTNYEKLIRMINVPNGILLVTGATGSGKSTTTYSILQTLNKKETNIITVEDPVEMNIEGLNQVQVNSEIGLDFATVLRSILRQDPNIILIGEIRDSETAKIAVRASITGHFVLSTIHTNNSLSTIERLLDMSVERYLLSSALTGIISQRLAKMLCPKCKTKRETTKYEKMVFRKVLNMNVDKIYDANENGCPECHHGYKGRIAIQEVLEIDDNLRDALNNENLTKEDRKKLVYKSDVITLLQDGLIKVLNGITSFDEIYKAIEIDYELDDYDDIDPNKAKIAQKEILSTETATNVTTPKASLTSGIVQNIVSSPTEPPIPSQIDNENVESPTDTNTENDSSQPEIQVPISDSIPTDEQTSKDEDSNNLNTENDSSQPEIQVPISDSIPTDEQNSEDEDSNNLNTENDSSQPEIQVPISDSISTDEQNSEDEDSNNLNTENDSSQPEIQVPISDSIPTDQQSSEDIATSQNSFTTNTFELNNVTDIKKEEPPTLTPIMPT